MMHYVSGANATAHNWRLQHRTMHSANVIQALSVRHTAADYAWRAALVNRAAKWLSQLPFSLTFRDKLEPQ